jgi:hypothetical protein
MIYFIVTTSIYNNSPIRETQYTNGITKLKEVIRTLQIPNSKIILVENNGPRATYLDSLGCDVYYTTNNRLPTSNIGHKEIADVMACISHFNIQDDDFIVKMTGRYVLEENSEFMIAVKELEETHYDCLIKYASFCTPHINNPNDSITGLIGMRCKYVKTIQLPPPGGCIEWMWARASHAIEESKRHSMESLGINICPGSNSYFRV